MCTSNGLDIIQKKCFRNKFLGVKHFLLPVLIFALDFHNQEV